MTSGTFNKTVYAIVKRIPPGMVAGYGFIAALAGNTRAARAVGYAMAACPVDVPAHRVVFSDGSLSRAFMHNGKNRQYTLLKAEGISFTKDKKVKMAKHSWALLYHCPGED